MLVNLKLKFVIIFYLLIFIDNGLFSQIKAKHLLIENINKELKDTTDIYYLKANNYLVTNTDSAIKYANIGLLLKNEHDAYSHFRYFKVLNDAYKKQGNYKKEIFYLNLMIQIAENKKDLKSLSDLYLEIGDKYLKIYTYEKAFEYTKRSLEAHKQLNDSIGILTAYKNLAKYYLLTNNHEFALKNLQLSLNISLEIQDKKNTAIILKNFGNVYSSMQNPREALEYQLKALKIFEALKDKKEISNLLINIGGSYSQLKKFQKAIQSYKRALRIKKNNKDKSSIAYILNGIGRNYLGLKNYDSAYVYLKQVEKIVKKTGGIGIKYLNYGALSEMFAQAEDYKNAYEYQNRYIKLKDSIFSIHNNEKINKLKIKNELNKSETENELLRQKTINQKFVIQKQTYLSNFFITVSILIALLVLYVFYQFVLKKKAIKVLFKKNQQIYLQKNQLEEAYATKEKLFTIITHDLKNPFGTIISLAGFLEESFDEIDDVQKNQAIKTLKKSANAAYTLLENLTKWLMSQNKNLPVNKSVFDISIAIKTSLLLYKFEIETKKIKITSHIPQQTYVYADEQMIKTIIRNLLSNAIKFTPENGNIAFEIKNAKQEFHISIRDFGIGIKEENKAKLFKVGSNFTTTGTSKEKGSGIGLILANEFAERNGSKIWFESEEGNGSTFYFSVLKSNNNG